MASVGDVYRFLDQRAPFSYQLDFDNAGFLVGREGAQVTSILVALDLTEEVLEEAIAKKVNLIVTHHPLIWGKLSAVTDRDLTGKKILTLLEHGIAVISAHTNLDAVEGGVNTALAESVGLKDCVPLQEDGLDQSGKPYGIGRVGALSEEVSLTEFARRVKTALGLEGIRMMDARRPVHRVAVGGGACGGMLADVLRAGCDTFVTSELKHDVYLEAKSRGINLIDAGHYGTEAVVCPILVSWLKEAFPSLSVELASQQGEVFSYL